jgi:hypothetical protein
MLGCHTAWESRVLCNAQNLISLISDSLIGMSPTAECLASYCLPAMGAEYRNWLTYGRVWSSCHCSDCSYRFNTSWTQKPPSDPAWQAAVAIGGPDPMTVGANFSCDYPWWQTLPPDEGLARTKHATRSARRDDFVHLDQMFLEPLEQGCFLLFAVCRDFFCSTFSKWMC